MTLLRDIDRVILKGLQRTGIGRRQIRKDGRRRVPILGYHEIRRANFENHIRYLRSIGCCFVSMDRVGRSLRHREPLPHGAVAVTFDDGWKSNYTEVFPVASEQSVPVTIYLISGIYSAGIKPGFFRDAELKSGGNYSHTLSVEQIAEMADCEYVAFGSHTVTHAVLDRLPADKAASEITESRLALEALLKRPVLHFAYPKGFFSAEHPGMVRQAGYDTAVTVAPGWNDPATADSYALRRIAMSADDDVNVLSAKLAGFWYSLRGMRRRFA